MTHFILGDNFLTEKIPATLVNCTALKRLKLSNNSFYGDLDINFSSSIEAFSVHSNKFCGTLPASLDNCKHLKLLNLSRNQLTGEFPPGLLANCQELRVLSLGFNRIEGRIPLWTTNLTSLQVLDLSNNNNCCSEFPLCCYVKPEARNYECLALPFYTLYLALLEIISKLYLNFNELTDLGMRYTFIEFELARLQA